MAFFDAGKDCGLGNRVLVEPMEGRNLFRSRSVLKMSMGSDENRKEGGEEEEDQDEDKECIREFGESGIAHIVSEENQGVTGEDRNGVSEEEESGLYTE